MKSKYFAPNRELYAEIINPKSKESTKPIDPEELLWGVNDLVITLPNRSKITIFPEPQPSLEQKKKLLEQPRI